MKKLLLIAPIVALAACGDANKKYDAAMDGCTRIETTAEHLVYKCPMTLEWVASVKASEPNGVFMAGSELNLTDLVVDAENVYVEVLPDSTTCPDGVEMRAMVATPSELNWAVISCK